VSPSSGASRLPLSDLSALFAGSRLALLLVGVVASNLLASGLTVQRGNLVHHTPVSAPLEIWARWDAEWYLLIAERGYDAGEVFAHLPVGYEPEAASGFFPLYPFLIRVLAPLLGGVGAGVLISNVCLAASLLLLYRLTRDESPPQSGGRAGLAACAALLVFPASLFLSAVYAESLFLMLSLIVFATARRARFAAAGMAGALAALTRPTGLLTIIPIAVEWWGRRRDPRSRWGILGALGPPAGTALFMVMCGRIFGDPLAFVHRQERWRGAASGPWRAFARWWQETPAIHGAHDSTLELMVAILFIGLLPAVHRRLRPSYALYATATVLLPLCSTLWSFGRLALAAFPVFMIIGMASSPWGRRLAIVYGMVSAVLSGLSMALFATWWWAG
jgi:hypothetical protein